MFKRLGAPALDFCQLRFRLVDDDVALAEIDRPHLAVDGEPISLYDRSHAELCAVARDIDVKPRAADNAGLAHLARYQRRMCGSTADGRHNSRGDGEARDIGRAGIDRKSTRLNSSHAK